MRTMETMEMREILELAKRQLADSTGLEPLTVTRGFRDEEGWHVGVEMVELSRIPHIADVLGDYEVLLAEDGQMLRFQRRRTKVRGEPTEEQGG